MNLPKKYKQAFTLVELLVVVSLIGVLGTMVATFFGNSQLRARDAKRKSDLNQLSKALEIFYNDNAAYPADSGGSISACPYNKLTQTGTNCTWGTSSFSDGSTSYVATLPKDPTAGRTYFYRIVPGSNAQKFQLFARLESIDDKSCLGGNCSTSPVTYSCGSGVCNFAITSPNTSATE